MSKEVNRKLPARNTTVQLLILYAIATMHSVTDRWRDNIMMPIADQQYDRPKVKVYKRIYYIKLIKLIKVYIKLYRSQKKT